MIRTFTMKQARTLADEALEQEDENQVRILLNNALEEAGIAHAFRTNQELHP